MIEITTFCRQDDTWRSGQTKILQVSLLSCACLCQGWQGMFQYWGKGTVLPIESLEWVSLSVWTQMHSDVGKKKNKDSTAIMSDLWLDRQYLRGRELHNFIRMDP